ncbi:hypothetical protein P879_07778 [Paragonimus westermani]|uniref:Uncharacterized protein n=1 Tax=Paragonimus westermani TaxID=34504 RepID=A0A8T0D878_9TREM|nr:hypothetical protein P879_07778 [Paragonimus westermani]
MKARIFRVSSDSYILIVFHPPPADTRPIDQTHFETDTERQSTKLLVRHRRVARNLTIIQRQPAFGHQTEYHFDRNGLSDSTFVNSSISQSIGTRHATTFQTESKTKRTVEEQVVVLKEFVLPENGQFSDRLVTLEDALGSCILRSEGSTLSESSADRCTHEPIDIISPVDGVVIDWDRMVGIDTTQFWNYFERALFNETFSAPVFDTVSTASARVASLSWWKLTPDYDRSQKQNEIYPHGLHNNDQTERYLQHRTSSSKNTKGTIKVRGSATAICPYFQKGVLLLIIHLHLF